jgi:acyl phosphate:glycerol-3-phosphate acyltransferase
MQWNEHWQMVNWPHVSASVIGAYLIGCFTTGYYLVRARTGQDIRTLGSGSAGARNVGRFLGKSGFFLTVLGDFLKGMLAVWIVRKFTNDDYCAVLAIPAVAAGHLWPVQLKFHGGKGVVTSAAAVLVFDYRIALTGAALLVAMLVFTRKTLLPAMFGFLCLPAVCWFFTRNNFYTGVIVILSAEILFAHRRNLGEEFSALKSEPPKL